MDLRGTMLRYKLFVRTEKRSKFNKKSTYWKLDASSKDYFLHHLSGKLRKKKYHCNDQLALDSATVDLNQQRIPVLASSNIPPNINQEPGTPTLRGDNLTSAAHEAASLLQKSNCFLPPRHVQTSSDVGNLPAASTVPLFNHHCSNVFSFHDDYNVPDSTTQTTGILPNSNAYLSSETLQTFSAAMDYAPPTTNPPFYHQHTDVSSVNGGYNQVQSADLTTEATGIQPNTHSVLPPGTFQTGSAATGPAHTTTNPQFYSYSNGLSINNGMWDMMNTATGILPNTRAVVPPRTFQTDSAATEPAHSTTNPQFYGYPNGLSINKDSYNPLQMWDMMTTAAGMLPNSGTVHPPINFQTGNADMPSSSHGFSTDRYLSQAIGATPPSISDFITNRISSSMDNVASTPTQGTSIGGDLFSGVNRPQM